MTQSLDSTPGPSIGDAQATLSGDAQSYGYQDPREGRVACTQAELMRRCGSRLLPPRVWTPESAEMVRPWDVPMLRHAIGERIRERHARVFATVAAVVFGLSVWSQDKPGTTAWLLAALVLLSCLAWNP